MQLGAHARQPQLLYHVSTIPIISLMVNVLLVVVFLLVGSLAQAQQRLCHASQAIILM